MLGIITPPIAQHKALTNRSVYSHKIALALLVVGEKFAQPIVYLF